MKSVLRFKRKQSADLDTSFEKSSPQPEIKVHLEFHFNLRSVLLDFQSFSEQPVFECTFAHPIMLFLSYLVTNRVDRVFVICKISHEMASNAHGAS